MTRDAIHQAQRLAGCTIAPRAFLPHVRVLATSFKHHHPGAAFSVLVTDGFVLDDHPRGFDLLGIDEIGLPPDGAGRLLKVYSPEEAAGAIKPWLLKHQLSSGADCVVYFDPSTYVLANSDTLGALAQEHQAVLALRCPSLDDCEGVPNEAERFRHEPGFVAVGGRSSAFLDWWSAHALEDVTAQRSLDRALLDRIPGEIRPHVLEGRGWNLGYWNLPGRELTAVGESFQIDGEPVRFFNFSGYDPEKPHLLSKHQGHAPRVLLSESPALANLCRQYRDKVLAAAREDAERYPHGFGCLPSGLKIDRHMHRLYTQAVARFEANAGPQPPDAMSPGGETAFIKWLNQRTTDGKPDVTRYMLAVHAGRPDLQAAFPEPLGRDATGFHAWFISCGRTEEGVPRQLMPNSADGEVSAVVVDADQPPALATCPAVNIVGYFRAELGNGETARLLLSAFEAAQIPFTTTVYEQTFSRQQHPFELRHLTATPPDIDLICINADRLPEFFANQPAARQRRYTIGLWFWEVDEFPPTFDAAFDLVNEVWVASDFVGRAISKVSPKPVFKIILPIIAPPVSTEVSRATLKLPDRFMFLFSFDFLSLLERKNAVGLINAFTRAFERGEGPMLVVKSINGDQRVPELERLKFAADDHPDIRLLDGYFSAIENNALGAMCDCYVSLHRSEGFGQTISEAMALGKPAIATAYSGNLDFMTADNSYLCPYSEREVGPDCEPYPALAHWAEPDLDEAAALMRHVYSNREEARARGARAAEDLSQSHSPALAGRIIRDRLRVIQRHQDRARAGAAKPQPKADAA